MAIVWHAGLLPWLRRSRNSQGATKRNSGLNGKQIMPIISQYAAVWKALNDPLLPIPETIGAIHIGLAVCVLTLVLHELGHLIAGRLAGLRGRIGFFVRRGESPYWYLSVLGVRYDDSQRASLSRRQVRIIAAAGPIVDIVMSLSWLFWGASVPGPVWLPIGVAFAGALYFGLSWLNWFPLPIRNDGWIVLFPQSLR
jgi:hypothetical protein